jgi:hypothetical protein
VYEIRDKNASNTSKSRMASLVVEVLARAEDDGPGDKITLQCIGRCQQEPEERERGGRQGKGRMRLGQQERDGGGRKPRSDSNSERQAHDFDGAQSYFDMNLTFL